MNKPELHLRFMRRHGTAPDSIRENSELQHSNHIMNPIRIIALPILAVALVSCAAQKDNQYDTSNPYGAPDGGGADSLPAAPSNPVYDTPAAYEESGGAADPAPFPNVPAAPAAPAPANAAANAPATIHTVVAGDTLSGISAKYKVPAASIKTANRMTNDTVVLGRKMVIPPH